MSNDTAAESIEEIQRTGVIIVGGGISGLFLGMLLERLELSYHIFERATEVRPLGSALTLGANIQPAFEQLGLLEQLKAISLPCPSLELYSDNLEHIGSLNLEKRKEISGYDDLIFERSKLYSLLRSQIPDSKISYGKRVTRLEEKDGQVFIHCADGFVCQGDMLAGADGAYSNVRQSLYEQLEEKGLLPKIDTEDFVIGNIVMVGVAQPLNPEKYPQLNDTKAHFSSVQGKNKQILALISAPGQRVCWSIGTGLSEAEAKEKRFKNSEWGPEANELMIKEFEDHPSPWGGTFGDFIRMTPPHLVSRVSLEEKIFQTWFHGRTVLIGDACHKMLTGAGLGAVTAMQDAVVLANCIHNMPNRSAYSIKAAFEEYYRQQHHRAVTAFELSRKYTKVCFSQTWSERLIRKIMIACMPEWYKNRLSAESVSYRPQVAWLPLVKNRGTSHVLPQEGKRTADGDHSRDNDQKARKDQNSN